MRTFLRIVLLLLITVAAKADTFNFTFTGENFNAVGTLTGDLISPGVYRVTGITGLILPYPEPPLNEINVLYSPGELDHANNLLYINEPFVDAFGINFGTGNSSVFAFTHDEIGYMITGCWGGSCSDNNRILNRGILEVSSTVPEPSSLLLMASGLALVGTKIRRITSGRFS